MGRQSSLVTYISYSPCSLRTHLQTFSANNHNPLILVAADSDCHRVRVRCGMYEYEYIHRAHPPAYFMRATMVSAIGMISCSSSYSSCLPIHSLQVHIYISSSLLYTMCNLLNVHDVRSFNRLVSFRRSPFVHFRSWLVCS